MMPTERRDLIFRLFVSSTFSDFVAERNALQEKVFPELREYCQRRGARFQAIDLRWGVSQEAALDQQTMNICTQELRRCQELSPRPNFIVLLGDRYGWRPLPAQIDAAEFEALLGELVDHERDRLLQWYRRDDNAVPPEYCLLPREGRFRDREVWRQEEDELRAIVWKAVEQVLPPDDLRRRKYEDSATHQEIRHGALEADDPQSHVFCYFREIKDLPEDERAHEYRDIRDGRPDEEAAARLAALKGELTELLPEEHVHDYEATWRSGRPDWDLTVLCEDVKRDLQHIIDQELSAFEQRPDLEREVEAHREFAEERSRHFVGRQDILGAIRDYIGSDGTEPLIIHGKPGSGKTALMARAWLGLPQDVKSVARFIGATPGSADLRTLLRDLCREMGVADIPTDMNELVRAFRGRLSPAEQSEEGEHEAETQERIVLLLDALDQLNPTDNARMLYWLPRELLPNVKLVMSVLEEDQPEEEQGRRDDPFDIARRMWPESLVELGPLGEDDGAYLLDTWLAEANRTLQREQRADVLGKFGACPLPLFLKLAFEEARRWKSWEGLPCGADAVPGLGDSVEGILDDLFHRLEQDQNHGRVLVSRALGYIAAGKNGLTEDELLEALSADEEVLEDFRRRSPTERERPATERLKRLPVVVWSRLYADLGPYMTRRRADGTVVLNFYHRQVADAVRRRHLAGDALLKAHLHLAEYFDGLDYWAEPLEEQRARARRLPPTPRPANVRKVVELPHHRIEAAKLGGGDDPNSELWDAVADLLMDWQFLEAKAEADPNFGFEADRRQAAEADQPAEEAQP